MSGLTIIDDKTIKIGSSRSSITAEKDPGRYLAGFSHRSDESDDCACHSGRGRDSLS